MSIMIDDILTLPKTDIEEDLSVGDKREYYGLMDTRDEQHPVSRDVVFKVVSVNDDHYEIKILDIITSEEP
ncbi:hypothetical protein [Vreelandella populi]|uniref:Uncharacterized protein n=1 Tax=Vreelandella populi TaxID=2498858 RepID=A0A433L8E4_9GAMM|nr:hypothetical protein [Halomonas populi]RUR38394.1 hypothetical protein ELY25_08465 [Halomonas populi]RUR43569.1 hypothetical protein ELY37_17930 [Halomonas populi]